MNLLKNRIGTLGLAAATMLVVSVSVLPTATANVADDGITADFAKLRNEKPGQNASVRCDSTSDRDQKNDRVYELTLENGSLRLDNAKSAD